MTTVDPEGRLNVAPMGPTLPDDDGDLLEFLLRPFPSSITYANLLATREGVLHVTDDVLLLAEALLNEARPQLVPSAVVSCPRLADCCRYHEFRIESSDESGERPRFRARVVHSARVRDFFGFNRAKHAVVEAAILASRLGILPLESIREEFARLKSPLEKTGGPRERRAFEMLCDHVRRWEQSH